MDEELKEKLLESVVQTRSEHITEIEEFQQLMDNKRREKLREQKLEIEGRNLLLNQFLQGGADEQRRKAINSLIVKKEGLYTKEDKSFATIFFVFWGALLVYMLFVTIRANSDLLGKWITKYELEHFVFLVFLGLIGTIGYIYYKQGLFIKSISEYKPNSYRMRPFPLMVDKVCLTVSLGIILQVALKPTQNAWFEGSFLPSLLNLSLLTSIFYVVVFIILYFMWWLQTSKLKQVTDLSHTISSLQSDTPITSIHEDRFNRYNFAKEIVRIIDEKGNESITVGLYGEWGSGKSSVFNMIKQIKTNRMITIDFRPWYFGGDNHDIIRKFLIQFIEELDEQQGLNAKLRKAIANYAKYFTAVSIRPPGLIVSLKEPLEKLFKDDDSKNLTELKKVIEQSLRELDRPVVVYIDDVDRLDIEEVLMLFKLVRLVADFPNVTYLLALDDKQVVKALAKSMYDGEEDSEKQAMKYLEKFIQVPLYLPQPDGEVLTELCWVELSRVIDRSGVKVEIDRVSFTDIFSKLQLTPRNIKRFLNVVEFFLPMLGEEVCSRDLIYLLLLKIFSPDLFDFIRLNRSYFLDDVTQGVIDRFNKEDFDRKAFRQAERLLLELFPYHISTLTVKKVEEQYPKDRYKWRVEKRICSQEYFNQYFMYNVPVGTISQKSIKALIDNIERSDSSDQYMLLYQDAVNAYGLIEVNSKLEEIVVVQNYGDWNKWYVVFLTQYQLLYDKEGRENQQELSNLKELILRMARGNNELAQKASLYSDFSNTALMIWIYKSTHGPKPLEDMLVNHYSMMNVQRDFIHEYTVEDSYIMLEVWSSYDTIDNIRRTVDSWLQTDEDYENFLRYNFYLLNKEGWRDEKIPFLAYTKLLNIVGYKKLSKMKFIGDIDTIHNVEMISLVNDQSANRKLLTYIEIDCYRFATQLLQEAIKNARGQGWPIVNLEPHIESGIEILKEFGECELKDDLIEAWEQKIEYEKQYTGVEQ